MRSSGNRYSASGDKTNKRLWPLARILAFAGLVLTLFLALPQQAGRAQNSGMTFIRDAEIENYLRQLSTPIWRAADLDPKSINVAIIQHTAVNAFVAGGMHIFFYTGL